MDQVEATVDTASDDADLKVITEYLADPAGGHGHGDQHRHTPTLHAHELPPRTTAATKLPIDRETAGLAEEAFSFCPQASGPRLATRIHDLYTGASAGYAEDAGDLSESAPVLGSPGQADADSEQPDKGRKRGYSPMGY
jgi:hypothetical protein